MVTIYDVKTGQPFTVAFAIDAKEAVAGGAYSFTKPLPPASASEALLAAEPQLVDEDAQMDNESLENPHEYRPVKPKSRKPLLRK